MANESQEPKPHGNADLEAARPLGEPADIQAKPAATAISDGDDATGPVPLASTQAENQVPAAGPAPQVTFTPDASPAASGDGQPQPAPEASDALIGDWLAEHMHHADIPYLVLVVLIAFLLGSFAANNTDIWQYLATGRLLSEGKYTLGEDPFAAGVPADGPRLG